MDLGSSAIVETAIGLALVFFLGAGLCTAIVEAVASIFQFRAKLLWRTVDTWFRTNVGPDTSPAFRKAFGLLKARAVGARGNASPTVRQKFLEGIPGLQGADTGSDGTAVGFQEEVRHVKTINREAAVTSLTALAVQQPNGFARSELGKALARVDAALTQGAATAVEKAEWVEQFFDAEMERLSKAYRSRIRWYTAAVALVVVPFVGLDAIALTSELYRDPTRRQVLLAAAEQQVADGGVSCDRPSGEDEEDGAADDETGATTEPSEDETSATTEPADGAGEAGGATTTTTTTEPQPLEEVQAEVGCARELATTIDGLAISRWQDRPGRPGGLPPGAILSWEFLRGFLTMIVGLAIAVAALAAGAPFWFSILQRLMGLRKGAAGKS